MITEICFLFRSRPTSLTSTPAVLLTTPSSCALGFTPGAAPQPEFSSENRVAVFVKKCSGAVSRFSLPTIADGPSAATCYRPPTKTASFPRTTNRNRSSPASPSTRVHRESEVKIFKQLPHTCLSWLMNGRAFRIANRIIRLWNRFGNICAHCCINSTSRAKSFSFPTSLTKSTRNRCLKTALPQSKDN